MSPTSSLITVPVNATLGDACRLASEYDLHYLLVVDEGMLVGLSCLSDVVGYPMTDPITRHMSRRMWITFPESTLADAARIMSEHRLGCLPVVDDGQLAGLICRADLIEVGWVLD
jgi:CBS domain-containing protein